AGRSWFDHREGYNMDRPAGTDGREPRCFSGVPLMTACVLLTSLALLLQGPGELTPARPRETCDDLKRQGDALGRELPRHVPARAALHKARRDGPDELAARLAPGEVFVDFVGYRSFAGKDKNLGSAHYAAFLLWKNAGGQPKAQVHRLELGEADPIDRAIN